MMCLRGPENENNRGVDSNTRVLCLILVLLLENIVARLAERFCLLQISPVSGKRLS